MFSLLTFLYLKEIIIFLFLDNLNSNGEGGRCKFFTFSIVLKDNHLF